MRDSWEIEVGEEWEKVVGDQWEISGRSGGDQWERETAVPLPLLLLPLLSHAFLPPVSHSALILPLSTPTVVTVACIHVFSKDSDPASPATFPVHQ